MLFVLAVTMLLIAMGSSVLASASAGAGAGISRQALNQLNLYADSTQRTIMHSLQSGGDDVNANISVPHEPDNYPKTLGGQLLAVIYKKASEEDPDPAEISLVLDEPTLDNGTDLSAITGIVIRILPSVQITEFAPAVPEVLDPEGVIFPAVPRQPQTAAVSAEVTVTVTAKVGVGFRERLITSVVTYAYSGGLLEDNGNISQMIIMDAGEWRFVSHEKIDA